jgi:hypothetical protein
MLSARELAMYSGSYYSEELQADYIVTLEDDKLSFSHHSTPKGVFTPTLPDEFRVGDMHVTFTRNTANQISGFLLATSFRNTRNLEFVRK